MTLTGSWAPDRTTAPGRRPAAAASGRLPLLALVVSLAAVEAAQAASVAVDASREHQRIDGFGATHEVLVYGDNDVLGPYRAAMVDAAYNQVRLSTGNVAIGTYETRAGTSDPWGDRGNDDALPLVLDPLGWDWAGSAEARARLLDLAGDAAFPDWYLSARATTRWEMTWATPIRAVDYDRYIEELAEHVVAAASHWRDAYGRVQPLLLPLNEPLTGNRELSGATSQEVVDLVKRAGRRLAQAGLGSVKLVVPGEETEEASLGLGTAILADPEAASYVGVLAYHTYPYGSLYSSVPNILATSGSGNPDPGRIAVRQQLGDLARARGVRLWMTEVSHGFVDPRSFDSLRARAIHIHDEMVYAGAGAYFGMNNAWDTESQFFHFGNRDLYSGDNEGHVVLVDQASGSVTITGMGRAIGHYARWLRPGAVRLEATSDDPLLLVTAFRDDAGGRLVLVAINNRPAPVDLTVNLAGVELAGAVDGEQSTAAAAWAPLVPVVPSSPAALALTLPALSVTSLSGPIADCAGTAAPGDLGNTLAVARAGDDLVLAWSPDPVTETANLYRRPDKVEGGAPVPYRTGLAPTGATLPGEVGAAPERSYYRVTGVSCSGREGR
jgi:O-glycosyl hydrolase